tara:strand:- start:5211 stop:5606 length:396 start_codon:yes stop_codon:yes gene_type:complete
VPDFAPFKDLKVNFKPHPITGDLQVSKEDAAIKQSIVNLLMTVPGERPFQPQLGSSLSELLFDPLDYGVAALIKNEINDTVRKYEPRVNVVGLTVEPNFDDNAFDVNFEFEIRGREDVAPLQINFLLQRTQ